MTCNRVAPVTFAFAFALVSVYIVSALRIRRVCSLCQHRSLSLWLFAWYFYYYFYCYSCGYFRGFPPLCKQRLTPLSCPSAHPCVCVRSCACGYSYRSICRLYFLDLGQRVCENRKFCFGLECAMPCLVPPPSPLLLPPSSAGKMCRIRCCCCWVLFALQVATCIFICFVWFCLFARHFALCIFKHATKCSKTKVW